MIGVYLIRNKVNGKSYVGSALNIKSRWNTHISRLNGGKKELCNPYLLNSWNKYGHDNFEFSVIEECTQELLHDKELYWMRQLNTLWPNGFNLREAGNHGRLSEDTKKKIGLANSLKVRTTEAKDKIRKANLGTKSNSVKLNESKVRQIYIRLNLGEKYQNLAKEFNVSYQTITNIGKKIGWAWLTDQIDKEVSNGHNWPSSKKRKIKKD